jgi:hypothetical protein
MSRNHARRLDAREPQHLDPKSYTFRRFQLGSRRNHDGSTNPAHLYHLSERTV